MQYALFYNSCWWLSTVALAVLLSHLFQSGIWKRYRYFSPFVGVYLLWSLGMTLVDRSTMTYNFTWAAMELHLGVMEVLVSYGILLHILSHFPRIIRFVAMVAWAGVVIAGSMTVLVVYFGSQHAAWDYPALMRLVQAKRAMMFFILAFNWIVWQSFRQLRVPLKPNLIRHNRIFSTFLLSQCIGFSVIASALSPRVIAICGGIMDLVLACASIAWVYGLRADGETAPGTVAPKYAHGATAEDILEIVRRQKPSTQPVAPVA